MRNVSSQRSTTAFTTSPLRDRKPDSALQRYLLITSIE